MPIAHIRQNCQSGLNGTGGTPSTISCPITAAANAGDTCILVIGAQLSAGSPPNFSSIGDTKGNTWTIDVNGSTAANANARFGPMIASGFMTNPLQPGDSVVIYLSIGASGSVLTYNVAIDEFSGIGPIGRVNRTGTSTSGASSVYSLAVALSAPTTDAGALIYGSGCWWGSGGVMYNPAGWNGVAMGSTTNMANSAAWWLPGATGTANATWQWSATTMANCCEVAYLPGGPSSGFFLY